MISVTTSQPTPETVTTRLAELAERGGSAGVPKRDVFALAKECADLPPGSIEELLEHADHDTRVAAVSIMDFQARRRKLPPGRRRRHLRDR